MDALTEAMRAYMALPVGHPDEPDEFADAIHRAQDLLAVRIARRYHPAGWSSEHDTVEDCVADLPRG